MTSVTRNFAFTWWGFALAAYRSLRIQLPSPNEAIWEQEIARMTAMDLRPVEGAEKEEGAEWIDTSDPMPEAIVPGTPGAPKELGPVVAEEFCAEKPMQFFARRKSFSWGEADWSFSDNAGNLEFEVTGGKFGYVSVKRFLTDAYGNQVLQMQNKVITCTLPFNSNESCNVPISVSISVWTW